MSAYIFEHNGKQFTPDGRVDVPSTTDHNAAISARAMREWQDKPAMMLAYYRFPSESARTEPRQWRAGFYPSTQGATVSLWTGETIGTITHASVYAHNFGARMVSLRVRGSNGAEYYGRASYDNGSCIWLRRVKA